MEKIFHAFELRGKYFTAFEPEVVETSARDTKIYKICQLRTAIFSAFYNISRQNLANVKPLLQHQIFFDKFLVSNAFAQKLNSQFLK